jgi:hypothetical protein
MNGHLILQFKDGRLTLHPVANSDEEMTDLLSAIRESHCRRRPVGVNG